MESLTQFQQIVGENVAQFVQELDEDYLAPALSLLIAANDRGNRIHITGIGKPSHVAQYGASLMSSIAVPTYFLDGTEAVHGSCGQLRAGDVVICISNSGETAELKATVIAVKNNGCKVIGVTGDPGSWLARNSDLHLFAGVGEEGGPLNRAPRNSILAELLTLQALSVALQADCGQTPADYVRCHPGGKLGQLREGEN